MDHRKSQLEHAVKHYSALFTFPSLHVLIFLLLFLSVGVSAMSFIIYRRSINEFYAGAMFGFFVFFMPSIVLDLLLRKIIVRKDKIFNLRRCVAATLFTNSVWISLFPIGSFLSIFLRRPIILVYSFVFGACVTFSLRYIIFNVLSTTNRWRVFSATFLHPLSCLFMSLFFWGILPFSLYALALLVSAILLISTFFFLNFVNEYCNKAIGIGGISLFRAFATSWMEGLASPLESHLESLGREENISINLLAFRSNGIIKSLIAVPTLHPGPFRNVGSSGLPLFMQKALEKKFDAVVAVTHGLSGHELDLTSKRQCKKVLKEILNFSNFKDFYPNASPVIRVQESSVKVTCQIFGKYTLITITCAPRSMEDIPTKIGLDIVTRGKIKGAENVIVIDAHNSIGLTDDLPSLTDEDLHSILKATEKGISLALKEQQMMFEVGAAKIIPNEFKVEQGIGPAGITVLVVKTGKQKFAYIIIDGNNMITGLREKILSAIQHLGVDDGEVLTTDSHLVNAVTLTKRGYYPIGEAIDQRKLIEYVKKAAVVALNEMKEAEASLWTGLIRGVKVIGEDGVFKLTNLVDAVINSAKRIAVAIFVPTIFVSILLFAYFG